MKLQINSHRLKQLRTHSGWTQEQLADEAAIHSRTVQRIESEGVASIQSTGALARALNVKVDELLTKEADNYESWYSPTEAFEWVKTYTREKERIERWIGYSWVGASVFGMGGLVTTSSLWFVTQNLNGDNIFNVLIPGASIGLVMMGIGAYMVSLSVRAEKEKRTLQTMSHLGIPPWLRTPLENKHGIQVLFRHELDSAWKQL